MPRNGDPDTRRRVESKRCARANCIAISFHGRDNRSFIFDRNPHVETRPGLDIDSPFDEPPTKRLATVAILLSCAGDGLRYPGAVNIDNTMR